MNDKLKESIIKTLDKEEVIVEDMSSAETFKFRIRSVFPLPLTSIPKGVLNVEEEQLLDRFMQLRRGGTTLELPHNVQMDLFNKIKDKESALRESDDFDISITHGKGNEYRIDINSKQTESLPTHVRSYEVWERNIRDFVAKESKNNDYVCEVSVEPTFNNNGIKQTVKCKKNFTVKMNNPDIEIPELLKKIYKDTYRGTGAHG